MAHRRDHFDEWGGCQCWCDKCADPEVVGRTRIVKPCTCPDCRCQGGGK